MHAKRASDARQTQTNGISMRDTYNSICCMRPLDVQQYDTRQTQAYAACKESY